MASSTATARWRSCRSTIGLKTYGLAAFVIDVKQRTYHADIVAEGVAAWFYSGTFEVDASGQWTAGKPKVQHAQAAPKHE
ncbi:MAG: hypothetical protein WCJ35_11500 [Planctomycetota bacterium]